MPITPSRRRRALGDAPAIVITPIYWYGDGTRCGSCYNIAGVNFDGGTGAVYDSNMMPTGEVLSGNDMASLFELGVLPQSTVVTSAVVPIGNDDFSPLVTTSAPPVGSASVVPTSAGSSATSTPVAAPSSGISPLVWIAAGLAAVLLLTRR